MKEARKFVILMIWGVALFNMFGSRFINQFSIKGFNDAMFLGVALLGAALALYATWILMQIKNIKNG